jgi:hypothetical protein
LIKDPKQRLQSIGEARIALDQWVSHPEEENPATVGAADVRAYIKAMPNSSFVVIGGSAAGFAL